MSSQASTQGLSLYDAARAMGVRFANENEPQDKFVTANGMRFHYLEWGERGQSPDAFASWLRADLPLMGLSLLSDSATTTVSSSLTSVDTATVTGRLTATTLRKLSNRIFRRS